MPGGFECGRLALESWHLTLCVAAPRFKHNPFVNGDPPVRFYCGTPLIASNGHRLGTLCFADNEPHEFDAERCNILNNMAELCVREIEREHMMRLQQHESNDDYMVSHLAPCATPVKDS